MSKREQMIRLNSIRQELKAMDLGWNPAIEVAVSIAETALAQAVSIGNQVREVTRDYLNA